MKRITPLLFGLALLSSSFLSAPTRADPALPSFAIHHISVAVPDLDAAIAWYSDVFGLSVEQRMDIGIMDGAFLKNKSLRLELWHSKALTGDPATHRAPPRDMKVIGLNHFGIVVPDLVAAIREFQARKVTILLVQFARTEPMKPDADPLAPGKRRPFSIFIADPFGTSIEVLDGKQVGDGV